MTAKYFYALILTHELLHCSAAWRGFLCLLANQGQGMTLTMFQRLAETIT
jgi:hypothetical protein